MKQLSENEAYENFYQFIALQNTEKIFFMTMRFGKG